MPKANDPRLYTGFVSEVDQFFQAHWQNRSDFPESMVQEQEKHRALALKRDQPVEDDPAALWDQF